MVDISVFSQFLQARLDPEIKLVSRWLDGKKVQSHVSMAVFPMTLQWNPIFILLPTINK